MSFCHHFFFYIYIINNNKIGSSKSRCLPFVLDGIHVGYCRPIEANALVSAVPDVFIITGSLDESPRPILTLHSSLVSPQQRTTAVMKVMERLRDSDTMEALRGWRNELYAVQTTFGSPVLMEIERSAAGLLGVKHFGTHLNAFVKVSSTGDFVQDTQMWVSRRSATKPTWPGKLDNLCAGGLTSGVAPKVNMIKECKEEASIPEKIAEKAVASGIVCYFSELPRGLFAETQFVYDLELPNGFHPVNSDGEVGDFYLWDIPTILQKIVTDEFKPNCALVFLDFLIRRGVLTPENTPLYCELASGLRRNLFFPNQVASC